MSYLGEILDKLMALPDTQRAELVRDVLSVTKGMRWVPSPGPQTEAYFSKADILLYGGEPGGGKTSLLLGLAYNCHQRSLIMRRQYTDLGSIVEDLLKLHGSRYGFNGSSPPSLRLGKNRLIELGAAIRLGDEQHWQGNPHDFIGFDEGTQFVESQVRFLMGWLRSTDPGQRCRVVIATNPPLTSEGQWVVEMFAPWLDQRHSNPAKSGELRYFVTDDNGKDLEVDGPEPVTIRGTQVNPISRTFIPASVEDNPFLACTNYRDQLAALVEPYRSILLGGFKATFRDATNQCIPTDWVKQAQARWKPSPPIGVPMCAMSVDATGGGDDEMVIAMRYDSWFAPLIVTPAKQVPLGRDIAGLVLTYRRDQALVVVDMCGGYGGATYEHLQDNGVEVRSYKGSEESGGRTKDRQLKFTNKRTARYWALREALDPGQEGGSTVALPPDPKLVADLTSPTFEVTNRGIKLESKEEVCKKLGRSPDRGDAIVMAHGEGPTYKTDGGEWMDRREKLLGKRKPKVIMGRR